MNTPYESAYAQTPDALKKMMTKHPDQSPSTFLADDSFAAHCYDHLTGRELRAAFERDADGASCRKWGLSAIAWKDQIAMALIARGLR